MVTFTPSPVVVRISRRAPGQQYQEVQGMVAENTLYAYHPVPERTVLHKKLPDALMITRTDRHSSVVCSLLPADAPTAEMCILYLLEHLDSLDNHDVSPLALIDQCAKEGGKWYRLSD